MVLYVVIFKFLERSREDKVIIIIIIIIALQLVERLDSHPLNR